MYIVLGLMVTLAGTPAASAGTVGSTRRSRTAAVAATVLLDSNGRTGRGDLFEKLPSFVMAGFYHPRFRRVKGHVPALTYREPAVDSFIAGASNVAGT